MELVEKALALTGTIVMGLPIMVDLTDAERNRQAAASAVKSVAGYVLHRSCFPSPRTDALVILDFLPSPFTLLELSLPP